MDGCSWVLSSLCCLLVCGPLPTTLSGSQVPEILLDDESWGGERNIIGEQDLSYPKVYDDFDGK